MTTQVSTEGGVTLGKREPHKSVDETAKIHGELKRGCLVELLLNLYKQKTKELTAVTVGPLEKWKKQQALYFAWPAREKTLLKHPLANDQIEDKSLASGKSVTVVHLFHRAYTGEIMQRIHCYRRSDYLH